ncbi:hypothetical protein H8K90_07880 [Winogradskyella echinorum]|uniref:Uncharacterized protein n=1 Tax=Winogradskyella echinorum TaxID=538189 RepID=A0ABR6Y0M3_9FLAO|nr:hypothetical protein [Winogradskyella echinorum]MBC3846294.1 hypothetical protein [Winogradskyella echinorum]MBC5750642.1 hypothetical protein [Winogradskyella echinorum]
MEINAHQLKHIKVNKLNESFCVSLVDHKKFEITKGYGNTVIEAINDMHDNLI